MRDGTNGRLADGTDPRNDVTMPSDLAGGMWMLWEGSTRRCYKQTERNLVGGQLWWDILLFDVSIKKYKKNHHSGFTREGKGKEGFRQVPLAPDKIECG